jgi:hypothetical protein
MKLQEDPRLTVSLKTDDYSLLLFLSPSAVQIELSHPLFVYGNTVVFKIYMF